jgi:hypothetical protein
MFGPFCPKIFLEDTRNINAPDIKQMAELIKLPMIVFEKIAIF